MKFLKKKNKLYRKYIINPTPLTFTFSVYKFCRNKYNHLIRNEKKKYFSQKLKCCKDIKNTWEVLNQLLQREKRNPDLPSIFSEGLKSFTNSFDIAKKFDDFFVGICYELAQRIPLCHGDSTLNEANSLCFYLLILLIFKK